jgi:hypothetical protein
MIYRIEMMAMLSMNARNRSSDISKVLTSFKAVAQDY